MAEWRLATVGLKESVTLIQNYVDTHLVEEEPIYEVGDMRFISVEQRRAVEAEHKLKDKLPHTKLRKYLMGHIACLDTLKANQLRKSALVALEQVHLVFDSLLALKLYLKPILNQQQQSYMIKFFNAFEQTEAEMR